MGRPTKYKAEYAQQAADLCNRGATDVELADHFKVSVRTLHRWKLENEEFCHSLRIGKSAADDRVERSLFERALGYVYTEQQAIKVRSGQYEDKVKIVQVERVSPPDPTCMIFWLKNRRSDQWRDKRDEGLPMTAEDAARVAQEAVARAMATVDGGGAG